MTEDHTIKGAPFREDEQTISGDDPLSLLADGLFRRASAEGTGELVARELAELRGAAVAGRNAAQSVAIGLRRSPVS